MPGRARDGRRFTQVPGEMEEHVAPLIVDGREREEIDDEVISRLRNSVRTRGGITNGRLGGRQMGSWLVETRGAVGEKFRECRDGGEIQRRGNGSRSHRDAGSTDDPKM